ncbi:hypothetical protein As57867_005335, partial [Aphanomyces stellatus]
MTISDVLVQNSTLSLPLANVYTIMTNEVGPFGSIDMRFVPCPLEAKEAMRNILSILRSVLAQGGNETQSAFDSISNPTSIMLPVPKAWSDANFQALGGSPLCPEVPFGSGMPIVKGIGSLMSWDRQCAAIFLVANMGATKEILLVATVLAQLSHASPDAIAQTCGRIPSNVAICVSFLTPIVAFVGSYMAPQLPTQGITSSTIQKATAAVQALNINLVQFGQLDAASPVTLYRINVLDPTEGDFAYFGWIFLMDWARGYREAVTLAGDSGTLTVLTDHLNPIQLEVNLAQAPTMMAVYLRNTVLFITVAMIVMASVMLAYIVSSRGHFEVSNLYQLQRVGAFVWVGRPLVLVRSLTAVALLST